ncbi:MAG: hypothetical protein ACLSTO_13660 [Bilophila wadsworthia]
MFCEPDGDFPATAIRVSNMQALMARVKEKRPISSGWMETPPPRHRRPTGAPATSLSLYA